MKTNLYIKALEIGYLQGDEGISFEEIVRKLNNQDYEFSNDLFKDWFYRNFEHSKRFYFLHNPVYGVSSDLNDKKLRLSSDSLFQYLEYVELKEARENSKSAK